MNDDTWEPENDDRWEPDADWLDREEGPIDGDELEPLEEVAARLRTYRQGRLYAYLSPAVRWEQDLHPYVLKPDDERLVRTILAAGDDPGALERLARPLDAEWLRDLVRRTVTGWKRPAEFHRDLHPYVHKQQGDVLWLLERVAIGLTAVEVEISISGQLPANVPYPDSYPANLDDPDDERRVFPKEWWQEDATSKFLRLSDDRGTKYQPSSSGCKIRVYPVRVLVGGQWEARVYERYWFLFIPGIPEEARELTLTGQIDLAIEQPSTEPMPWPTRSLSLGDYSYTIDLEEHWWPPKVDEEYLESLVWADE